MDYCFLDLETTGFDPDKDSIIEVSFVVRNERKETLNTFDEVIVPTKSELTSTVTHITGISQGEIDEKGLSLSDIRQKIQDQIGESVIVGHNIDFDIGFLVANGIDVSKNPRIDTHELSRILLVGEESYALEILSQKYGFVHTDAHRAMSDVEASVDLFGFLCQRIEALPSDFLRDIQGFLQTKTDWYAKRLFQGLKGVDDFSFSKPIRPSFDSSFSMPEFGSRLPELSSEESIFIEQDDSIKGRDAVMYIAQSLVSQGKKVVILSPKLSFFPWLSKFPTPEVLLDPERLAGFVEEQDKLDNAETTFYLKCFYRHFLGFRGVVYFDLFFQERQLWKQVCVLNEKNLVFQSVLEERQNEDIIALTPQAFWQFQHLPLWQDRVLILDEGEVCAEKLLFSPTKTYSLLSYMESKNDQISTATQFWVTHFCREVIEPKLRHMLSSFPQKLALSPKDRFLDLAQSLREIDRDEEILGMADVLENPPEKSVRWVYYNPENGHLSLSVWKADVWQRQKELLQKFSTVIFHRHNISDSNAFFRVFLGKSQGIFLSDGRLVSPKSIQIPSDLISVKDPKFNSFCARKIIDEVEQKVSDEHWLVVNFSSQESLKKVFTEVSEYFFDHDVTILGEKVTGGDGKLLEKLKTATKVVLFTQNLVHPALAQYPFQTFMVQKFPFSPPHPLLDSIDEQMKQSGQSLWDVWTMPHVMAHLSRRLSVFPSVKGVIWLDPRENSRWGKGVLKSIFSS